MRAAVEDEMEVEDALGQEVSNFHLCSEGRALKGDVRFNANT